MSRLQRIEDKAFSNTGFDAYQCHEWLELLVEMDPDEEQWIPRDLQMIICDYVRPLPLLYYDRNEIVQKQVEVMPIPVL